MPPAHDDHCSDQTGTATAMKSVRIAAVQTPEYREDVAAAVAFANEAIGRAQARGASLVCFPEGYLQGYLTDAQSARRAAFDLDSPEFLSVVSEFPADGPVLVIGMIELDGGTLFNTAVVLKDGKVVGRYRKRHLLAGEPAFAPGTGCPVFEIDCLRFGINICYDTNFRDVAGEIAGQEADLIVCLSNNMMGRQKATLYKERHNEVRAQRCRETGLWLVSADVTGETEHRAGWGPTAVISPAGEVVAQLPLGEPGLLIFDIPLRRS